MEFHSYGPLLPCIPDDQTVGQFVFDTAHSVRPKAKEEAPWLVEDATGHCLSKQEVSLVQHLSQSSRLMFISFAKEQLLLQTLSAIVSTLEKMMLVR